VLGHCLSPLPGLCSCAAFCYDIREKGTYPFAQVAQVVIVEQQVPPLRLLSLRSGRDDNIYSTNFRDATVASGQLGCGRGGSRGKSHGLNLFSGFTQDFRPGLLPVVPDGAGVFAGRFASISEEGPTLSQRTRKGWGTRNLQGQKPRTGASAHAVVIVRRLISAGFQDSPVGHSV
jgi:hypothetical protein